MDFYTKETLREELPLEHVCAELGIEIDERGKGLCPFHDDHNPSFGIYVGQDGTDRWKCWTCDIGGDLFDLIGRSHQVDFIESIRQAQKMLGNLPESTKSTIRTRVVPESDRRTWYGQIDMAQTQLQDMVGADWGWGLLDGNLIFPHYDWDGRLTAVKVRTRDGEKWSWPGSQYVAPYGAWRKRTDPRTFLCEGETDWGWAVSAFQSINHPPHVLALPSGDGSFEPEWLSHFDKNAAIWLAFDGDAAGYAAVSKWLCYLEVEYFRDVRVCKVPDGEDLRSWNPNPTELLENSVCF